MLHDYLRFITEPNNDTHSVRKHVCKWWLEFLHGVSRIGQLYLPADEYDLGRITHVYNKQCASTVRTLIEANGGDITELLNTAMDTKLNKRQKDVLSDLKTKQAVSEDEQAKRDMLFEKAIADNPAPDDKQKRYEELKQQYLQEAMITADKKARKAIEDDTSTLTRSERVLLIHASSEQRRFEQLVDNWHWSPENEAYKERLKLCDEDLSFE